ncbi:MAG: dihydropyrimidinase [Anaerolineae bacterium]
MVDLLVRGGRVVTPEGIYQADVAVEGETIAAVGHLAGRAWRTLDARGCLVLPGLVDAHVHMQCAAWNAVTPNDFGQGSIAAALGGVTTFIDFATQRRGRPMIEAVETLRSQADGRTVIDYGLHLSVTDASLTTLREIEQIVAYGIPSFKMFMTYRSHDLMLDDAEILEVCRRVHECGGLPGVHAENDAIATRNYARFEAEGRREARYHAEAKPTYAEAEAIQRAVYLAQVAGSWLYVYHLSTAEGVERVRQARRAGQPILAETCTHYLTLDRSRLEGPEGYRYICSPPLRDVADQEALWSALGDGTVSVVSTDEAGFNAADKAAAATGPLQAIPNGLPGVAVRLPVLFTLGVETGRLSLERFVALNCSHPARIFGLYPRKGVLAPGSDADLIVIDPQRRVVLNRETQQMPVDWCAYDGLEVAGFPAYTVARGRVLVDDYRFCGERGGGRFVPGNINPRHLESLW